MRGAVLRLWQLWQSFFSVVSFHLRSKTKQGIKIEKLSSTSAGLSLFPSVIILYACAASSTNHIGYHMSTVYTCTTLFDAHCTGKQVNWQRFITTFPVTGGTRISKNFVALFFLEIIMEVFIFFYFIMWVTIHYVDVCLSTSKTGEDSDDTSSNIFWLTKLNFGDALSSFLVFVET